jgi:hypothetical protein
MKTKTSFIDLTQRPPRSFRVRLGNYVILARMLDKGRATVAGKNGEYKYYSTTDQRLVQFLGFDPDALLEELAFMEKRGPESDAETLALFAEYLGQLSKTREDVKTWFEAIELDDYASFGGKA